MKYRIEAMIKAADSNEPYQLHTYIHDDPDVDRHMQLLVNHGFRVLSVKSMPIGKSKTADMQGNQTRVDDASVLPIKEV